MLLDKRIKYVDRIKRSLNHWQNGIKCNKNRAIKKRFYVGKPPTEVDKAAIAELRAKRVGELLNKDMIKRSEVEYLYGISPYNLAAMVRRKEIKQPIRDWANRLLFYNNDFKNWPIYI